MRHIVDGGFFPKRGGGFSPTPPFKKLDWKTVGKDNLSFPDLEKIKKMCV